ncbi:MAG: DNA-processing protein DprA [Rhodoglobus sp.]
MFGLKEAEVASLVRAVAGDDLDRAAIEERFARATWTGIAEPGDRTAGQVVAAIGAVRSLAAVVDRLTAAELLAELGNSPGIGEAELQQGIDRWRPRIDSGSALLALRQAARFGARLRIPSDDAWPAGLLDLEDHAPLALWTRGTEEAFRSLSRSMALVGARAATGYGEHVTMEASAGLVDRGYSIVSGAAYGIDGMAHRAALASQGQTIAFLAGGVDRFYPSGHDALLSRIVESGSVVSEVPCGIPPTRWRFLQRNRLIAASSLATIVLEAGWRSGSLNTAGHAAALGRPLGAVPGPVTSAASAGCHRLIREFAAVCVTSPDEMAELAPFAQPIEPVPAEAASAGPTSGVAGITGPAATMPEATARLGADATRVLDALSARSARSAGDVAARAGLSVAVARSVLARLLLDDRVHESERGWLSGSAPRPRDPLARTVRTRQP